MTAARVAAARVAAPRVAAVDWSGAKHGEARHLWVAEWDPLRDQVCVVVAASRDTAVNYLLDLAARDPNALVGLDFNFSFPEWWLDTCGVDDVGQLWEDGPRLEGWLAECSPPFWGRPGRRRPQLELRQHFRVTELAATRRPKSVFQIGGAGAVGTGSLRGMPALARLRKAGFAIWPFDAARGPTVAEVWPRLAAPSVVKRQASARGAWLERHAQLVTPEVASLAMASEDAFDAVAAAIFLARAGRSILSNVTDAGVRREGWIAGVTLPPSLSSPPSRPADQSSRDMK